MQNANRNLLPAAVVPVKRILAGMVFLSLITLSVLTGCGGGAESQSRPPQDNGDEVPIATGSLNTDDIRAFKQALWEKLSPSSVCGGCHRKDADQTGTPPYFVSLDINEAYNAVVNGRLVNLTNPADSVLVKRVAGGHQCWLKTTSECETAMIGYIEAWANGSKKGQTNVQVQVKPLGDAQIRDPAQGLFFPVEAPASYTAFHNLVTDVNNANCVRCHASTAPKAITPYFADPDAATSYNAVKTVMDINDPAKSRVYQRLLTEHHNCWTDCPSNSSEILALINNIRTEILDKGAIRFDLETDAVSKALTMQEGNVISSGNRYEASQIALYEFKSGAIDPDSKTIYDTSGVEPAINLTLDGNDFRWLNNWGIEFTGSRARASVEDSRKLYNLIRLTGEYSVEAWLIPANVTQENATIVTYSGGATERNFALGQTLYNYDFYQRSSTLGADGGPELMTNDDAQDLQATLQHVVITYDRNSGRRIYVNGKFTGDDDPQEAGDLLNWHPSYILSFANELSNDRPWSGILRLVAIHDRALTPDQVRQNYAAEVGQKYLVPFNVSHLLNDGTPHSYVVFEVNRFDEFSYLFRNPRFINVDPDSPDYIPSGKALRGIRIGMNGQDVSVGQAYTRVSIDDLANGYSPQTGLLLSGIDTVIPIQNGASDEFFLTFEQLGDRFYHFSENDQATVPPLPTVTAENKPADIGLRTFEEINASMAQMTGIADWQDVTDIHRVYSTYKQQLPAVENIETFLSSQQMAIAQLAMSYCNELVIRDEHNAPKYFPGFAYIAAGVAFNTADKVNQIIHPLLAKMLNVTDNTSDNVDLNLQTQPAVTDVKNELTWLINGDGTAARAGMVDPACTTGAACVDRTRQIVKASCAAVLGSAAMLVQ